jgi:hypothetical protein
MMLKVSEILSTDRESAIFDLLCITMFSPRCRVLPEPEAVLWAD